MTKVLLGLLLLPLMSASPLTRRESWIIGHKSQLTIHGKTNVTSFTCIIPYYKNADTLHYIRQNNNELIFDTNEMIIPVYDFNCGNNMVTKDLRRSVKADLYPHLFISFISINKKDGDEHLIAKMEIKLAGIARQVDLKFLWHEKDTFILLSGTHEISFSDFALVAPKQLMGLIKVQQQMNVEFTLFIQCLA